MSPTWETTSDWDSPQSETGCHHEQPSSTDWAASDTVEKGWPTSDWVGTSHGLRFYFPMQEDSGSTCNEVTGTASDGSITGATVGVSGVLGNTAYSFDGVDDVVNAGHDSAFCFDTSNAFSFLAWVKKASGSNQTDEPIIAKWGGQYLWKLNPLDADGSSVGLWVGGSSIEADGKISSFDDGSWHCHGVTYDETNGADFYLDGTNELTTSTTNPCACDSLDNFEIGARESSNFLNGDLCHVIGFDTKLSSTQVSDYYQAMI